MGFKYEVITALRAIDRRMGQLEKLMSRNFEALQKDVRDLNQATNDVGVVLGDLRDRIKAGLSEAEAEQLRNDLEKPIARLQALAADPEQPVPPAEPTPA